MTLVELLVAMVILLIGIWVLVHGFPLLFRDLSGHEERTRMTKAAAEALARVQQGGGIGAVYGVSDQITPVSLPEDPGNPDTPQNAIDDYVFVQDEAFTVPAPAQAPVNGANPPPSIYAFKAGLCDGNDEVPPVEVYRIVRLTQLATDPGIFVPPGSFYLAANGALNCGLVVTDSGRVLPTLIEAAQVSYAWLDDRGQTHYVNREFVDFYDPFAGIPSRSVAASGRGDFHTTGTVGDGVVEGSASCWALVRYDALWDPGGADLSPPLWCPGASCPAPHPAGVAVRPVCYVERMFGSYIRFNPVDAGRDMLVSYRVRRDRAESGAATRRSPLMIEDRLISPSDASNIRFGVGDMVVQLATKAILDEPVLGDPRIPAPQADGNDDTSDIHLIALDLNNGDVFFNDATNVLLTDPREPKFGYASGEVKMRLPLDAIAGHTFRFIYRTPDRNNVELQKAPATFVEAETADLYPSALAFRAASRVYWTGTAGPYTVLTFTPAVASMTIAVDYIANPDRPTLVTGELHTVPQEGCEVTLNRAGVVAVKAVRGVGMRARATWLSAQGNIRTVDVNTLTPS
jgi:hypothetical protein